MGKRSSTLLAPLQQEMPFKNKETKDNQQQDLDSDQN
jgi:hypothetical protein